MKARILISCIYVFTLIVSLNGQISFHPYQSVAINASPEVVAIGDVNNDGLNDVVVGIGSELNPVNDRKIFVYIQNASGHLNSPVKYAYNTFYPELTCIAVADVNNDNLNDVVIGNGDSVGIYFQDTTGLLLPIQNYYGGTYIVGLECGDLNNDGKTDIAICPGGEQYIRVLYQSTSGFTSATYIRPNGGWEVDVGDVNGDGLDDVVVMGSLSYLGGIHVYTQNNTGGLNNALIYWVTSSVFNDLYGIAVGDLNQDGLNDVVATKGMNQPKSRLVFWHQDGATGLLQNPPAEISCYDMPEPIKICDLNCDGANEVIVAHGGWQQLSVFELQPDGTFSADSVFNIPYVSHYRSYGMAYGDINGDGKIDIALANGTYGLVILKNRTEFTPTNIDTTSTYLIYDTTYTNTFTHSSWWIDTTHVVVNNYQITTVDSNWIEGIYRGDSIRVDTVIVMSKIVCGTQLFVDTTVVSSKIYIVTAISADTSLVSSFSFETNIVPQIKIYPNPTQNLITIDLPDPYDKPGLIIYLRNVEGKLIDVFRFNDKRNRRVLYVNHLPAGAYMLSFSFPNQDIVHRKIIKI